MKRSWRAAVLAALAAGVLALSACAGAPGSTGPVTLEYWTWAPNMAKVADVWNKAHPDIQVKVSQAAGADDIGAKLLAATRAGQGPDIAQAEYQKLPNFVVSDAGQDISEYVGAFKGEFSDAAWNLVTVGGKVYGVPQDTGPMIFVYRADLFAKYGLQAPKTWDEYAALAKKVREVAPTAFLGGYPDDGATFAAYAQPLGTQWWSTDGQKWKVDINSANSKRVASFWQSLVEQGLVDTTHFFTPDWNTKMNDGTLLSWTAGAWAPGVMASVAPDTAGKWAAAPMPTWGGEPTVGLMGGSSAMVTKTSKHPAEAVQFLEWLNGSAEGSGLLGGTVGLFPASTAGQAGLAALPVPSLVSGQKDYWTFAAGVAKNTAPVTWGPNVQIAFNTYSDAIKAAVQAKSPFGAALDKTQDTVVADLKTSGFEVG
jgi:multiple sugar transport system substrate-binding protein